MQVARHFRAVFLVLVLAAALPPATMAGEQGLVAIVNDVAITEHDITLRIELMKILGDAPDGISRKGALQSLIDDQVKIAEATRLKVMPTEAEIRTQVARMAKNMDTTADGLSERLKKRGISEQAFFRYVGALMGINRIISGKYRNDVNVTDAEIDRKFAEIKSKAGQRMDEVLRDPRMKPVTVFTLMEISLPAEGDDAMLLQSRAIEGAQVAKRFSGCGNARAAAEGIFNVKIGKKFDVDAAKLPKQVRAALEKAGTGRAVGPMRGKSGIQLVALCATRKLTPPKPDFKMPTREQVTRALINQKYDEIEENYLKTARASVYVEYRNTAYAQQ